MRLDRLCRDAGLTDRGLLDALRGDAGVDVRGITHDSRAVSPGWLFACIPGTHADGHDYAPAALAAGASALVVERPLDLPLPQVVVASTRAALGWLCDAFFDHPSRSLRVVGVTGTNGKTTTCAMLASIFQAAGWPAEVLGTLTQARTTPEAPELQQRLAELRGRGTRALAMEVSSHALDQRRADGTRFAAAVFTNLTQDHLDYHETMDAYFEAKARLFESEGLGLAVINRGDPYGARLIGRLAGADVAVETFAPDDAADLAMRPDGSAFTWHGQPVRVHLAGRFNVTNALAAATCAAGLGVAPDAVAAGLDALGGIPGRFQRVDAGQPFAVVVDYAHTPDGLAQALGAAREITSGRVVVVFGAGGGRDQDKRPLMGAAAEAGADLVVVTSDNPRHEDPQLIVDQVVAGVADRSKVVVELDRRRAIAAALAAARPGDTVLIAGKGHETVQEAGGQRVRFDDVVVATDVLGRILASRRDRPGR